MYLRYFLVNTVALFIVLLVSLLNVGVSFSVFVEGRKTVHVIVNCYYYLSLMHSLRREQQAGNTCSPYEKAKI